MENTNTDASAQATPTAAATETVTTTAVSTEAAAAVDTTQTQTVETKADNTQATEIALKLPEGSLLKPEVLEQIKSYAKEKKLAPEVAQSLLERENAAVKGYHDQVVSSYEKEKASWVELSKNDSEIGGEHFGQNVELGRRAMEKFANPAAIKIIEDSGYGNHPDIIRMFMNIGKAMAEDKMVQPGAQAKNEKSMVELFYGPQTN